MCYQSSKSSMLWVQESRKSGLPQSSGTNYYCLVFEGIFMVRRTPATQYNQKTDPINTFLKSESIWDRKTQKIQATKDKQADSNHVCQPSFIYATLNEKGSYYPAFSHKSCWSKNITIKAYWPKFWFSLIFIHYNIVHMRCIQNLLRLCELDWLYWHMSCLRKGGNSSILLLVVIISLFSHLKVLSSVVLNILHFLVTIFFCHVKVSVLFLYIFFTH